MTDQDPGLGSVRKMGRLVQGAGWPGGGSCEVDNYTTTVEVTELRKDGLGGGREAGRRPG